MVLLHKANFFANFLHLVQGLPIIALRISPFSARYAPKSDRPEVVPGIQKNFSASNCNHLFERYGDHIQLKYEAADGRLIIVNLRNPHAGYSVRGEAQSESGSGVSQPSYTQRNIDDSSFADTYK